MVRFFGTRVESGKCGISVSAQQVFCEPGGVLVVVGRGGSQGDVVSGVSGPQEQGGREGGWVGRGACWPGGGRSVAMEVSGEAWKRMDEGRCHAA